MHESDRPDAGAADPAAPLVLDRKHRFIVRSHLGSPGMDSTLTVAAGDADEARSLAERFWRNFYQRSGRSIEPFTVTAVQACSHRPDQAAGDQGGEHPAARL